MRRVPIHQCYLPLAGEEALAGEEVGVVNRPLHRSRRFPIRAFQRSNRSNNVYQRGPGACVPSKVEPCG